MAAFTSQLIQYYKLNGIMVLQTVALNGQKNDDVKDLKSLYAVIAKTGVQPRASSRLA